MYNKYIFYLVFQFVTIFTIVPICIATTQHEFLSNKSQSLIQFNTFEKVLAAINKKKIKNIDEDFYFTDVSVDEVQIILKIYHAYYQFLHREEQGFINAIKNITNKDALQYLQQLILDSLTASTIQDQTFQFLETTIPQIKKSRRYVILKSKQSELNFNEVKFLWLHAKQFKKNQWKSHLRKIYKNATIDEWILRYKRIYNAAEYDFINKNLTRILARFKNNKKVVHLSLIYLESLSAKKKYKKVLQFMKQHDYKTLTLNSETKSFIQLHLKALLQTAQKEKATRLIQSINSIYQNNNFNQDLYYQTSQFYFRFKQNYPLSLKWLQKIDLNYFKKKIQFKIQWYKFFAYYRTKNREQIKKIIQWAYENNLEKYYYGSLICYWTNKKIHQENDFACMKNFNHTFYGQLALYQKANAQQNQTLVSLQKRQLNQIEKRKILWLKNFLSINNIEITQFYIKLLLQKKEGKLLFTSIIEMLKMHEQNQLAVKLVELYAGEWYGIDTTKTTIKETYPVSFSDEVLKNAKKNNIPAAFILSIIREESRFTADAISPRGALGLMQLMPLTAESISKKVEINLEKHPITSRHVNITLGSYYLAKMLDRFKNNVILASAAYNAGPTNVLKWVKKYQTTDMLVFVELIPFSETRNYIRRVIRSFIIYEKIYAKNCSSINLDSQIKRNCLDYFDPSL